MEGPLGIRVGAVLPCGELLARERFEEAVVKREPTAERAEPALAPGRNGDELGDWLSVAGDHDFFTALDLCEQA